MKKILWVVVCGLMALSLMIAACGQAVSTTTSTTSPTVTTSAQSSSQVPLAIETTQKTPVTPLVEKPKYGGTLTLGLQSDVTTFAGIENC
jgi:hypothetical protein